MSEEGETVDQEEVKVCGCQQGCGCCLEPHRAGGLGLRVQAGGRGRPG